VLRARRRLKPGGLFVGTTTDTNVLIKKLQAAPGLKFGNSLYSVEFLPDKGKEHEPFDKNFRGRSPFNLRYRFYLKARRPPSLEIGDRRQEIRRAYEGSRTPHAPSARCTPPRRVG
jgi:hypothetical protein